jgi:hypothetical protein
MKIKQVNSFFLIPDKLFSCFSTDQVNLIGYGGEHKVLLSTEPYRQTAQEHHVHMVFIFTCLHSHQVLVLYRIS